MGLSASEADDLRQLCASAWAAGADPACLPRVILAHPARRDLPGKTGKGYVPRCLSGAPAARLLCRLRVLAAAGTRVGGGRQWAAPDFLPVDAALGP